MKIHVHKNKNKTLFTFLMFIAALFVIAQTWKQFKCPSVKQTAYIHTMDYSAIKRHEVVMNLENMLSDKS